MSKKILLLEGWGLNDDHQLKTILTAKNIPFESFDIDTPFKVPALKDFSLVLCSGPMSRGLSDKILTLTQALAFKKIFESQKLAQNSTTRFFAFGRGALILLASEFWGPFESDSLKTLLQSGTKTWIKLSVPTLETKNIMGLELSELSWDLKSKILQNRPTWLTSEGKACGWQIENNLYISSVDFLAVKDPSILPEYGYFDSSTISPVADFLDKIVL